MRYDRLHMSGPLKMDFLGGESERQARRSTAWTAGIFALVVGLFAAIGAGASYRTAVNGTNVLDELGNLPMISDLRRLAWGADGEAAAIDGDRVTFLFLGTGGEGHAGSLLTDTILLATADLKEKKVGIVSIPRDVAYPLGGGKFMKINAVHAYAEQKNPGHGARDTADAMEELLQTDIDHVVRVDFQGFVTLVDAVGGIDVNVEHAFTDNEYPTEDDKWQTIRFEAGTQHMDGERALKYVRSRHGNNGEAGDFARNRRQQLAILGLKDKLLSAGTFTNPTRLLKLYEAVAQNVQTDLSPWDLVKLAPIAQDFSKENITLTVLTDAPDGELRPANIDGAFMLFPRQEDWSEIREIVADPFKTTEERVVDNSSTQPVTVEIRNGTYATGFAGTVSDKLTGLGFTVAGVGNAKFRGYEQTVIFDLTNGKKTDDLARLKRLLDANISTTIPQWVTDAAAHTDADDTLRVAVDGEHQEEAATSTDFLIVLGDSSRGLIE
jgi:polyisoprenyl-teichoic acid--peptidoglycan teichoic acid transferase